MGHRGRFGKYGEIKRLNRLRRARTSPPVPHGQEGRSSVHRPSFKAPDVKKTLIKIRPARPSDSLYVAQLSERVFRIYGPYEKIISSWLESGMTMTLVAQINKKPAGFVMISHLPQESNPQHVSELLAIAVAPEKQRMGIGKMLLKEVEKKAAQMGISELFLHTAEENRAAQDLFAKNEYVLRGINKGFYPAGQNALIMSKKI